MLWSRLRSLLRGLRQPDEVEHSMADEMEFHIETRADDLMERHGLSRAEARRRARLEFGSIDRYKEEGRQARGLRFFDELRGDARYSLGQLRKYRVFTVTAVLTIALGVGVNAAMFSIINGTLLKPLPVRAPEQITRLASISTDYPIPSAQIAFPDYRDYRDGSDSFEDMAAWINEVLPLSTDNRTDRVITSAVSGNYFSMLGVRPSAGRLIRPADGELGGTEPIAVLGYSYWARQFAKDPSVLGKAIKLKGQPFTIAGVADQTFRGTDSLIDVDVYLPLEFSAAKAFTSKRDLRTVRVIARLKPEVSMERAQASLDTISWRLQQEYPATNAKRRMRVFSERSARPDPAVVTVMPMIATTLLLISAGVLLVAAVNVLGLFLARGLARREEMAMRAALGAGRWQLIRVCLVEAFLISAIGGAAGIIGGAWAAGLLEAVRPRGFDGIALGIDLSMDWRVVAYSTILIIVTALVVGLLPALRCARTRPHRDLHGIRLSTPERQRFRYWLVGAQLAICVAFLVVSGMFIQSLRNLDTLDLGFARDHTLLVDVDPSGAGYSEIQASSLYKRIEARLSAVAGVQNVAYAVLKPFGDSAISVGVSAEGKEPLSASDTLGADGNIVSAGYFQTMQIPLLRGRVFGESDSGSKNRMAVISDVMADRLWPGEEAVGKRFRMSPAPDLPIEIVGVVKASKQRDGLQPRRAPAPQVFLYTGQAAEFGQAVPLPRTFHIRTHTNPESIAATVQSEIRSIDANVMIPNVVTLEEQVRRSPTGFGVARTAVIISAALGLLVLALALVGTFGALSFMVGQRTQEIGIRIALGADRSTVLKMIVGHGLTLALAGTIGGLILGVELGRLLQLFLFNVSPLDPLVLISVMLLLLAAALFTCLIPARRATRIDPILALKCE